MVSRGTRLHPSDSKVRGMIVDQVDCVVFYDDDNDAQTQIPNYDPNTHGNDDGPCL